MISQWFIDLISGLWSSMLGFIPPLPDEAVTVFTGADSGIGQLFTAVARWGYIIPFPEFALALGLMGLGIIIGIAVKLVRIVLSYLTLGGGM